MSNKIIPSQEEIAKRTAQLENKAIEIYKDLYKYAMDKYGKEEAVALCLGVQILNNRTDMLIPLDPVGDAIIMAIKKRSEAIIIDMIKSEHESHGIEDLASEFNVPKPTGMH